MTKSCRFTYFFAFIWLTVVLHADVVLPRVLSDHMVLQREREVPLWGWAEPGESVAASFAGQQVSTVADDAGRWKLYLQPLQASKVPQDLLIRANNTITLRDVLVGEVWLASGQSNMEWTFSQCVQADQEYAATQQENPFIRVFHVN